MNLDSGLLLPNGLEPHPQPLPPHTHTHKCPTQPHLLSQCNVIAPLAESHASLVNSACLYKLIFVTYFIQPDTSMHNRAKLLFLVTPAPTLNHATPHNHTQSVFAIQHLSYAVSYLLYAAANEIQILAQSQRAYSQD